MNFFTYCVTEKKLCKNLKFLDATREYPLNKYFIDKFQEHFNNVPILVLLRNGAASF